MRKSEAYRELGYELRNDRWSWSAETDRGVCIDLWSPEIEWTDQYAWFDSKVHGDPLHEWGHKLGNKHRKPHLRRARDEFHGIVDVVLLEGHTKGGVRDAAPWMAENHCGQRWIVTNFDEETGHFSAVVTGRLSHGDR